MKHFFDVKKFCSENDKMIDKQLNDLNERLRSNDFEFVVLCADSPDENELLVIKQIIYSVEKDNIDKVHFYNAQQSVLNLIHDYVKEELQERDKEIVKMIKDLNSI